MEEQRSNWLLDHLKNCFEKEEQDRDKQTLDRFLEFSRRYLSSNRAMLVGGAMPEMGGDDQNIAIRLSDNTVVTVSPAEIEENPADDYPKWFGVTTGE